MDFLGCVEFWVYWYIKTGVMATFARYVRFIFVRHPNVLHCNNNNNNNNKFNNNIE